MSSGKGEVLSTNCYEFCVLKIIFPELEALTDKQIHAILLEALPGIDQTFDENVTVGSVNVGVRRLLENFRESDVLRGGLSETIQGEHLFSAVLDDAAGLAHELLGEVFTSFGYRLSLEQLMEHLRGNLAGRYDRREIFIAATTAAEGNRSRVALSPLLGPADERVGVILLMDEEESVDGQ